MSQRVPVEKKVMVLGDTPEAGRVAHDLLGLGYLVHWVSCEDTPIQLCSPLAYDVHGLLSMVIVTW